MCLCVLWSGGVAGAPSLGGLLRSTSQAAEVNGDRQLDLARAPAPSPPLPPRFRVGVDFRGGGAGAVSQRLNPSQRGAIRCGVRRCPCPALPLWRVPAVIHILVEVAPPVTRPVSPRLLPITLSPHHCTYVS